MPLRIGRYRRIMPMITTTKNTSTMPWTMANGGSVGGMLVGGACRAGTFRKAEDVFQISLRSGRLKPKARLCFPKKLRLFR
jgi:hypothetical protein